jgi:hypothetical protein
MFETSSIPKLITKKFIPDYTGDVQLDLRSRQVITIPFNDRIFKYELLSEFDRGIFESISSDGDYIDFSQIPDDKIVAAEYNCSSASFIVPENYMEYIKRAQPSTIKIIVYGIEKASDNVHDIILKNSKNELEELARFDKMSLSMELAYLMFEETSYEVVKQDDHDYYLLNINIPYEYYSRIPLIDSTFSYDINNHKFYDDDVILETEKMLEEFLAAHNKTLEGTFPRIFILANNNSMIPSHSSRSGSDIFLAKLLKIPYLPVTMVVSDWKIPFSAIEGIKCEIPVKETNELCQPYFIFPE